MSTTREYFKLLAERAVREFIRKTKEYTAVDSREHNQGWRYTLDDYMTENGFRRIGSGKYGVAYAHPQKDYILKVFMRDAAYLKWLDFAKRHPNNPHVPKIRGKAVKLGKLLMAVRLEKLERASGNYQSFINKVTDIESYPDATPAEKEIGDFLASNERLLDLHGENVMMRKDGTYVIVDPFYNWYRASGFTIDPDDVSEFKAII